MNDKQRFQLAAVESPAGGGEAPLLAAAAHALAPGVDPRAVVLVEGSSDRVAVEALAERRGRDLAAEGIAVVPMGGAQAIAGFLEVFGPHGLDVRLAGLGSNLSRPAMERLGFYVCVADLEDELIRSLGAAAVQQIVDAQGDLG